MTEYSVPLTNVEQGVPGAGPLRNASFGQALRRFFARYFTAGGRASQSEYWWIVFAGVVVSIIGVIPILIAAQIGPEEGTGLALTVIGAVIFLGFGGLIGLGTIWLSIRRLHDANVSGWWYLPVFLLGPIPLIGCIAYAGVIVIGLLPGKPEGVRFDVQS